MDSIRLWLARMILGDPGTIEEEAQRLYGSIIPKHRDYKQQTLNSIRLALWRAERKAMKRIDVRAGDRYGDLKVLCEVSTSGKRKFLCRCTCGRESTVRLGHLRSGHTSKCGRCGIEYQGHRRTITEWAQLYEINESTLRARLKVMSIGEALKKT